MATAYHDFTDGSAVIQQDDGTSFKTSPDALLAASPTLYQDYHKSLLADASGAGGASGFQDPTFQGQAASASDVGAVGAPGGYVPAGVPAAPVAQQPAPPMQTSDSPLVWGGAAKPQAPAFDDYGQAQSMYRQLANQQAGGSYLVKGGKSQVSEQTTEKTGLSDETKGNLSIDTRLTGQSDQKLAEAQRQNEQDRLAAENAQIEENQKQEEQYAGVDRLKVQAARDRVDQAISEADGKIEPGRLWGNYGLADKAGAIASYFLGAVSSALTGGPNIGIQMMHDAINRDIDAQKANMANKRAKVSDLYQNYQNVANETGRDSAARAVTYEAMVKAVSRKMQQMALDSNNPAAIAQAEKATNAMNLEVDRLYADDELRRAKEIDKRFAVTQDRVVGGGPSLKQRADYAEKAGDIGAKAAKDDGQTLFVNGQQVALPGHIKSEEAAKIREKNALYESAKEDLANLGIQQQKFGANSLQAKEAAIRVGASASKINVANGQGAMTKDDQDRYVSGLTGINSESAREAQMQSIDSSQRAMLRTVGARAAVKR